MTVEESLLRITAQLAEITSANKELKETTQAVQMRLGELEAKREGVDTKPAASQEGHRDDERLKERHEFRVSTAAKEKTLTLTFGDGDCSATKLRLFLDQYHLAVTQNQRRQVDGWEDESFRANELRFQLAGEPALWVAQESAMLNVWTKSDTEIITRLKQRYLGVLSLELNIVSFEELKQGESETLAQYMTKCQQKGMEAFGDFDEPRGLQQRIVWKFLSGIRDPGVRAEVIRQKWMLSRKEAKSYDEVLKIAQQAKLDRIAAVATGQGGEKKFGKVAAASTASTRVRERRDAPRRTPHASSESNKSAGSNSSFNSRESSGSAGNESGNFLCHYCGTKNHYGGWKLCNKRLDENPSWRPKSFQ